MQRSLPTHGALSGSAARPECVAQPGARRVGPPRRSGERAVAPARRRVQQAVNRPSHATSAQVTAGLRCAPSTVAGVRDCDCRLALLRLHACATAVAGVCLRLQAGACAPEMGAVAYTASITLTPQTAARPNVPTPLPAYLAAHTTPQPPWMISPVPTASATHLAISDGCVAALGVLPCSWDASHSAGGNANPLLATPAAAPSATAEAPTRLQCGVRVSRRKRDNIERDNTDW
jgi:hypothetical protein